MMFRALRVGMTHQTHEEIQKNILHQILHIYLLIKNPKIHLNSIQFRFCKRDVFLLDFLFLSEFAEYIIIISLLIFAKQEHFGPKIHTRLSAAQRKPCFKGTQAPSGQLFNLQIQ